MTQLLVAVFVASILGSAHCVGMCGPFVLIATGVSKSRRESLSPAKDSHAAVSDPSVGGLGETHAASKSEKRFLGESSQRAVRVCCYHAGRLTTYLILGVVMGAIGAATNGLAGYWGYANVAARVVGAVMIVLGVVRLTHWLQASQRTVQHSVLWIRWSQLVASIRKRMPMQSPYSAAYSWGLVSTWLPCGWLAIFAIAAAGAGGIPQSMAMMAAFWVGTLPLLSLVALGVDMLGPAVHRWIQPSVACVLIAFGIYTATCRASIDLGSLRGVARVDRSDVREPSTHGESMIDVESLKVLSSQELPCCEANGEADSEELALESSGK
ncbi:MAG: sulfite exporter TauE/SafE family protein [Planctomycetes bacterium]|nr:sulfite exporter TauE/SafE family protein [Planctomycetota bacterium]